MTDENQTATQEDTTSTEEEGQNKEGSKE